MSHGILPASATPEMHEAGIRERGDGGATEDIINAALAAAPSYTPSNKLIEGMARAIDPWAWRTDHFSVAREVAQKHSLIQARAVWDHLAAALKEGM